MIGDVSRDADTFDADVKLQLAFLLIELLQQFHIHTQLSLY